jgi:beta-glucosidase
VDLAAQEDAQQFTWHAPGAIALDGPPVDLERQRAEGFALRLDWRVDALGAAPVTVTFDGAALDLTQALARLPLGRAVSTRIPLECFAAAGADTAQVGTPLRISAGAGFSIALRDVHIEGVGESLSCPPAAR